MLSFILYIPSMVCSLFFCMLCLWLSFLSSIICIMAFHNHSLFSLKPEIRILYLTILAIYHKSYEILNNEKIGRVLLLTLCRRSLKEPLGIRNLWILASSFLKVKQSFHKFIILFMRSSTFVDLLNLNSQGACKNSSATNRASLTILP